MARRAGAAARHVALTWTNETPPVDVGASAARRERGAAVRMPWGPWFWWVHTPYSYLLTGGGMAFLAAELWRESKLARSQVLLLLTGMLLPLAVNVLFMSGFIEPDGRIGPTPFAFAVSRV